MRFYLIVFLCALLGRCAYAQSITWSIESKVRIQEAKLYNDKAIFFKQRKLLDSSLYFLVKENEHLIRLSSYKKYFFNMSRVSRYSMETFSYEKGLNLLQNSLNTYNALPDSIKHQLNLSLSSFYQNISEFYIMLNMPNLALEYSRKFLQINQRKYGLLHKYTAHAYNFVAGYYVFAEDYKKALEYYHQALQIYKILFGENSTKLRQAFSNIGFVYLQLNNYSEALSFLKKGLHLSIKENGLGSWKLASDYENIGKVYSNTGLYELSRENYKKALNLRIRKRGEKHPFVATLYNLLGELYDKQQKQEKSLVYFQKALTSNISNFFDTLNVYSLPTSIEHIYQPHILLKTLHRKAIQLTSLQNKKNSVKSAYQTYLLADNLVDNIRENLLRKRDELRLTSKVASLYENALQLCWKLSQLDSTNQKQTTNENKSETGKVVSTKPDNPYLQKAFYFAEKGKSSVLRKLATDASARIKSNIPEELLNQERQLNGSILYYQRQLNRFKIKKALSKKDSLRKQSFENRIFDLRRKYDELLRGLEQRYPDYYDLKHNTYIATVADVQKRLDTKTALIEYVLSDHQLYSFVITKEGFWVYQQAADRKKIEKEIKKWFYNIRGGSDDSYLERGHRFFKQFIQPIEKRIAAKKHLLIVPDGLLSHLPFEAFITKAHPPNGKQHEYPYLIRKWGVTLYPSASLALLKQQRRKDKYTQEFMGFAPVFKSKYANNGIFRRQLSALPYTKTEVENIHQLFTKFNKASKIYTGEQVSERLIRNLTGYYRFVHFATHGMLDDDTPILALYPDKVVDSVQTHDGELSLEEIFNLKFKADMVVLSSCQGGAGRNVKGEGILAITRGFVYLGVPNIIYTLWSVNDKDAAELMIRFYNLLNQKKSYREALRLAKLSMLQNPKTAWPKWWAGFTMMSKMR